MHHSYAAVGADKEVDKGRVAATKVHRYRAGKAPEWLDARTDSDQTDAPSTAAWSREVAGSFAIQPPVIVLKKAVDDPRLLRLAQRHADEDREEALGRRREIRAAEVVVHRGRRRHEEDEEDDKGRAVDAMHRDRGLVSAAPRPNGDEDEEEEEDRRRNAMREKLLSQQKEAEAARAAEEEEEEEESEYETDSEEERQLLRPVFVPKQARDTIAEREALQREDEEKEEREKRRLEERKLETQKLVRETVALEELTAKMASGPIMQANEIDTDDEKEDDSIAYEAWKERELGRMKRDKEENDKAEMEAAEKDRIRNMTEEERIAWEKEREREKAGQGAKEKSKMKFLQKYWHKGAYFQEEGDDVRATAGGYDIFNRDYSAPTGEDRFDKESMPAVMQVKSGKWGKVGQTKWKHLAAEDTTFVGREKKEGKDKEGALLSMMPMPPKRPQHVAPPSNSREDFNKPKRFKASLGL
jgi:microfibrillar-associated protein 1